MSRTLLTLLAFFALVALASPGLVLAQSGSGQVPGRIAVAKTTGGVFVYSTDPALRLPIQGGAYLQRGQTVMTDAKSSALMVLPNGATLQLGEKGVLRVDEFALSPFAEGGPLGRMKAEPSTSTTRLNLLRGEIISDVKKLNKKEGSSLQIQTPVGAAGIRGTAFRLSFVPTGDRADFALVMAEGSIEFVFSSNGKGVIVDRGRQLVIKNIEYDQSTGRIRGLPSGWSVEDVPAGELAKLMQALQIILGSVDTFQIQPVRADGSPSPEPARPDDAMPALPLQGILPDTLPGTPRTSPNNGRASL